jgi:hypothetical protein
MSTNTQRYYAGQGKVYLAPRGASGITGDFTWIGDTSTLELNVAQKFIDDYESYSGIRAPVIHVPTQVDVTVAMTVKNVSGDNLAKFLYGDSTAGTGSSVTAEAHTSYAIGGLVALKYPKVSSVVVHKGVTALVAGTDYSLDATMGTLTILATGGVGALTVDYTYGANTFKVEGLVETIKSYAIRFEGVNLADNNSNVIFNILNVPIDLLSKLSLIDVSKPSEMSVNGKALPAPEVAGGVGTGLSTYFNYTSF